MSDESVKGDSCCYGCFKVGPKESMPGWLCSSCVEERAAAKLEKESQKDE